MNTVTILIVTIKELIENVTSKYDRKTENQIRK